MSPQKPPPKAKPYPYTILAPPPLSNDAAKSLNPVTVLEYLRIEALLRSKVVFATLRWSPGKGNESTPNEDYYEAALKEDFHFSLRDSLQGKHHALLDPHAEKSRIGLGDFPTSSLSKPAGMWDLTKAIQKWPKEIDLAQEMRRKVTDPNRRVIEIDVAFPPTTIKDALDEYLTKWHKGVSKSDKEKARMQMHFKPLDPITWIEYFKCYDLRVEKGLNFGDIGEQVYGSGNPEERGRYRDRAETAWSRAQELIKLAEQSKWPYPGFVHRDRKKANTARNTLSSS